MTASALNDLGSVRRERGDLDGARELIERALAITGCASGPTTPTPPRS